MSPEWTTLISAISDVLVGLSAIGVAVAAIFGLQQWRAELKGRAKFELARRIAGLAYQFRDEFSASRASYTCGGEAANRVPVEGESDAERRVQEEHFAHSARLAPLRATARQLRGAAWEAEVVLDKDVAKHIETLEAPFRELIAAFDMHFSFQYGLATGRIGSWQPDQEKLNELQAAVYGGGADDRFTPIVDAGVQRLTEHLRRYLK